MDPVTHTLTGALIGQAGLKRRTGLAMPALLVGANLPDIDVVTVTYGIESLAMRRGITHGPIAWIVLPLLLAGALWWFDRWQTRRGTRPEGRLPVHFGWLYGLGFLACLTHPALDWLNVYGVRLLEPFSSRWFYGDTLFIIDVWLWAIMGVGLWLSLRREWRGGEWRRPAWIAIGAVLAYVGTNWAISRAAANSYPRNQHFQHEAIASPVPLSFWRREVISYVTGGPFVWSVGTRNWSLFTGLSREERRVGESDLLFGISCVHAIDLATPNEYVGSFLFWSRVPVLDRTGDGSVLIRDARYYDPRARNRFTVALPDVRCQPAPLP